MHRWIRRSAAVASLAAFTLAACLAVGRAAAGASSAEGPAPASQKAGALMISNQATATLSVLVQYTVQGGAQPFGATPRPPDANPVAGIEVDVVPAGDGTVIPVATGVTDADGNIVFDLLPGAYWVFVPASAGSMPLFSTAATTALPDDTPVLMWQAADLSDGNPGLVTLSIELSAP